MTDARFSTSMPGHPKIKKLIRRLGDGAAWRLVCLILWAAANRPNGDLSGMSGEDIELAADWSGDAGAFTDALRDIGFLDVTADGYAIHDWAEHQPWVMGSEQRSQKARWNAVKRHHGEAEADRQVPQYAIQRRNDADSNAGSNARSSERDADSNAPSPSPSPFPFPKAKATGQQAGHDGTPPEEMPKDIAKPEAPVPPENEGDAPPPKRTTGTGKKQVAEHFPRFWAAYPVKKGRQDAEKKWRAKGLDEIADQIIAHVRRMEREDDDWLRGFIPHGSTYINGERWEDEPKKDKVATAPAPPPESFGAEAALTHTESKLENALAFIRQQRSLGAYGEGEAADTEMRRLMAEATEKYRNAAASSGEARRPAPT